MLLWQDSAGGQSPTAPALEAHGAADQYAAALLSGASVSNQALAQSTRKQRGICWEEFSQLMREMGDWLQRQPLDATPVDIVAYCAGHWVVQHGESVLSSGSVCPAPSSLESMLSQLSAVFKLHGRCGEWGLHPQVCK